MPRYFFHILDAEGLISDDEGSELSDAAAAQAEALSSARDIIADAVKRGILDLDREIQVADEKGKVLFTVAFKAAVSK